MKTILLTSLMVAAGGTACVRSQAVSDENYIRSVEATPAKPGAKAGNAKPIQGEERRELIQYVLRLSDASNPVTAEDRTIFQQLPANPLAGSFQEAAGVIGAIRISLDAASQPRFQEQDLKAPAPANAPAAPATTPEEPSLEALAKSKGLEMDKALERNIVIKTVSVYRLATEALQKTKNSQAFHDRLWNVIQDEAKEWASLVQTPAAPAPATPTAETTTPPQELPKTQYSPADLRQGDATLAEADQLADDGNFKEAIQVASGIAPEDPFHDSAKEKIKIYSNRAVQTLRQKAAAAFQNAQPAPSPREKVAFLQEARKYLEEALSDYPQAEHLETVRENLTVITQNLAKFGTTSR